VACDDDVGEGAARGGELVVAGLEDDLVKDFDLKGGLDVEDWVWVGGLTIAEAVDGQGWIALGGGVGDPAVSRVVVESEPIGLGVGDAKSRSVAGVQSKLRKSYP
jgi:hypothetical protein